MKKWLLFLVAEMTAWKEKFQARSNALGEEIKAKIGEDTSFLESTWYNKIPAVKNGNVFYAEGASFYFADAYSLDFQLDFFKKSFLGN